MGHDLILDGTNLGVVMLSNYSRRKDISLGIDAECREKLVKARKLVDQAIDFGEPVYGLTTGLGARVKESLTRDQLQEFSMQTLRGRAQALGRPLSHNIVRGAMIARLNTLLTGRSGCSPELPDFLLRCLNANLTPVVGSIGSIGASDLCWGATMGLALTGQGRIRNADGSVTDASEALQKAGIEPYVPGPKDGLVLANNACFSATLSAIAGMESLVFLEAGQTAAALSMEAIGANLTPLEPAIVNASQQQGQVEAASQLRELLEGTRLQEPGAARKLQDPLSIRNVVQVHGAVLTAINFARSVINAELNASSDNPQVDLANERIVSCGAYYSASLTIAIETIARALDQMVVAQLARMALLLNPEHSGLPRFLATDEASSNGFAPLLKVAEAAVARARKELAPVDHWPSVNANGVEDIQPHAPLAAQSLSRAIRTCNLLCAMEMIMAARALEIGGLVATLPTALERAYKVIRRQAPVMEEDGPMSRSIHALAATIRRRRFRLRH